MEKIIIDKSNRNNLLSETIPCNCIDFIEYNSNNTFTVYLKENKIFKSHIQGFTYRSTHIIEYVTFNNKLNIHIH